VQVGFTGRGEPIIVHATDILHGLLLAVAAPDVLAGRLWVPYSIAPDRATLITLQLGNGCSAAAIQHGHSVDTSMGFSPLEGLVMGTRSGDLDASLVGYLARREKVDVDEVERWLNARSGLLGVSGLSSDMRDLLREAPRHAGAALAVELFCYRARKYIGAYLAVLGGRGCRHLRRRDRRARAGDPRAFL
jgi:Acetokinase family